MARNRMIKPEFWEDTKVSKCTFYARLFFIATWNFADDEGYLLNDIQWLKAKCLPYDNIDIKKLVDELVNVGLIEISGDVIFIKNFQKHQYINRPRPSNLSQLFKESLSNHGTVTEASDTKRENENENEIESESESEDDGEKFSPEPPPTPKEIFLSFLKDVADKNEKYLSLVQTISERSGINESKVRVEIDKFINYWTEKTPDGKRQLWQTKKTFEVQRRLSYWFSRLDEFSKNKVQQTAIIR